MYYYFYLKLVLFCLTCILRIAFVLLALYSGHFIKSEVYVIIGTLNVMLKFSIGYIVVAEECGKSWNWALT